MDSLKQVLDRTQMDNIQRQLLKAFRDRLVTSAAAAIGGAWTIYQLYQFCSALYLYFLHRSQLSRYQTKGQEASWALVTGSSDGIGKGFAEELCSRGFNVVIHGRNETKLNGVRDALLNQWPQRKVRVLVLDATHDVGNTEKMEAVVDQLKDIDIKILVNNVAGGQERPKWTPLQTRTATNISHMIDATARFPTEITRIVLPLLIRNSPSLIVNIGSGASEMAVPYVSIYAGCKAYNKAWALGVGAEMKAEGHDVEVLHILVGMVQSGSEPRPTSLFIPSSRRMAKSSLDMVGCGKGAVRAYWPHALQAGAALALPEWVSDKAIMGIVSKEKRIEQELMAKDSHARDVAGSSKAPS